MASRNLARLSYLLVAGAAALAFTQPLAAQEPPRIFFRGDGNITVLNGANLTLSDQVIRTLIETNLPDALIGDTPRHVMLVVDANDRYVSGKVSNATVISANGDDLNGLHHFVVGDSTVGGSANIVVIRRDGSDASPGAALPLAISLLGSKLSEGGSGNGVFGSGFSPGEVSAISLKRFAPGAFGTGMLIVSIVKLK